MRIADNAWALHAVLFLIFACFSTSAAALSVSKNLVSCAKNFALQRFRRCSETTFMVGCYSIPNYRPELSLDLAVYHPAVEPESAHHQG